MPATGKGARLFLRKRQGRAPVYVILETGQPERSTGTAHLPSAQRQLTEHLLGRGGAAAGITRTPDQMPIADALAIYQTDRLPETRDPGRGHYAIRALLAFWADLTVGAIKGATCRRYAAQRQAADGTIRRELTTLSAAIRFCEAEGHLTHAPRVTMPSRPETPQRALTRAEAARMLAAARGQAPHVARFIIVSLYSGTRSAATMALRLDAPSLSSGWFDLDAGVLYRRGRAEGESHKRRPPVRMPRQLLAHARRWHQIGLARPVEWRGREIHSIRSAWASVVQRAQLGWKPTPHTLKHTAITWAIESGMSITDAAEYFGTSAATIERVYWHRSPHYQSAAVAALEGPRRIRSPRAAE